MRIESLMEALPKNYSDADRALVMRAYRVADKAHAGQKRASGDPYITHCLDVAKILADMYVPPQVVAAGLLHDTVEDTEITLEDLRRDFGDEIAKLVDGVTKLTQLPRVSRGEMVENGESDADGGTGDRRETVDPNIEADQLRRSRNFDLQSETLRKTFLAMSDDVRVVLIKLADRLHNMRTIKDLPEAKRVRISQQTLDIFAPLANRLGIWHIKWELEDRSFHYVNPQKYAEIAQLLADKRPVRENDMQVIKKHLLAVLSRNNIEAEVTARPKHIYSIYKKMTRKGVSFDQVLDLRGVRILVKDIPTCYAALGFIHAAWRPIPGEFDDYIANPKDNFYQSLHTAVVYDDGKPLEIQIRTLEMNQNAEYGIAAHWRYKEGSSSRDPEYERRIIWLRSLMEWRQDVEDAREFVDSMKSDVFEDRVYVLTPKGDIIDLPAGSTPIDFAYHVHTEIGHRCRGAKVNGKLVALDYQLKTGEQVSVLTAKQGGPSRDWLNQNLGLVKTQRARSKIKQWFKQQAREQNLAHGRMILEKELRRLGMTDLNLDRLAREFAYKNVDDLYVALGTDEISITKIVKHLTLTPKEDEAVEAELELATQSKTPHEISGDGVTVVGLKGLLTSIARCCNPAPGDPIIGYITRGRGVTIHRQDCPNILRMEDHERLVRVSWGEPKQTYPVPVRIKAYERMGLVKDVSTLIADEGINMLSLSSGTNKNLAWVDLVMEVRDLAQLSRVLDRLENLPNVTEVMRVRPG
jgi:guanosine-3',5'-bis(diphosphate) 3'-pyrophosphohydrolase